MRGARAVTVAVTDDGLPVGTVGTLLCDDSFVVTEFKPDGDQPAQWIRVEHVRPLEPEAQ